MVHLDPYPTRVFLGVTGPSSLRGALLAHCLTRSSQYHATRRILADLVHRGYAMLRFSFTGIGGWGGTEVRRVQGLGLRNYRGEAAPPAGAGGRVRDTRSDGLHTSTDLTTLAVELWWGLAR